MATSRNSKGSNGGTGVGKTVTTIQHDDAKRKNIPTAEYQSVLEKQKLAPVKVSYPRAESGAALQDEKEARNRDLDPQLVWRGKDQQDWSDLVVHAPPLYIQEKVHAKALIDDLLRETREREHAEGERTPDLFADFNGIPHGADKTEFYAHDQNWSNRMILGDSLQVMASLAEREGLRGKVQCIYFDPPYGIKFNSNFQWSTTTKTVDDGKASHITREPEQVKAFRDTWRDGIHSYLTYLRDRLCVARDLLSDSGSIFLQIGDENVHRARAVLDEVFGDDCFISEIVVKKKGSQVSGKLDPVNDFILWYAKRPKESGQLKLRPLFQLREDADIFEDFPVVELESGERIRISDLEERDGASYQTNYSAFRGKYPGARVFALNPLKSGGFRKNQSHDFRFRGRTFPIGDGQCWKHTVVTEDDHVKPGMDRLGMADRLFPLKKDVRFIRYASTPSAKRLSNWWDGLGGASSPIYVVQTNTELVKRCLLMASDPGDLVLDPTCGSGTTAFVAEHWGRRWITIDTSRVALALARARIMGARYPFFLLADSPEGQAKEAEIMKVPQSTKPTRSNIRLGFVYDRIRSSTSGSIAGNAHLDAIWEQWQQTLAPLREQLNTVAKRDWEEWEVPRELKIEHLNNVGGKVDGDVRFERAKQLHAEWWRARNARQREIDASIAATAEFDYLYDRPYPDNKRVRVAGPFTVESLSPHRVLGVDESGELIDKVAEPDADYASKQTFPQMILENLKTAGVQQAHKEDRITFTALNGWPGEYICGEGWYEEREGNNSRQRRAAIFIGPEFGTVTRVDLVAAAREARDAGFDMLIACAFNFEAHTTEFNKLADLPVLKARMNADLHMAEDLKNTGKGNLFVIFGEPDISLLREADRRIRVKVNGVDVFRPNEGKVESSGPDEIACWFIDTDYNEESFFVRHAYFLGANDPYKTLRTTLKAEIDEEAWSTLHSDTSRPFVVPKSGRIAVKVINHLGDEVMKVFRIA